MSMWTLAAQILQFNFLLFSFFSLIYRSSEASSGILWSHLVGKNNTENDYLRKLYYNSSGMWEKKNLLCKLKTKYLNHFDTQNSFTLGCPDFLSSSFFFFPWKKTKNGYRLHKPSVLKKTTFSTDWWKKIPTQSTQNMMFQTILYWIFSVIQKFLQAKL